MFSWGSILYGLLWTIPFLLVFIWQKHHSHKHSHSIEKRIDQIIEIIRKDVRFSGDAVKFMDNQASFSDKDLKEKAIEIAKEDGRTLVTTDDVISAKFALALVKK